MAVEREVMRGESNRQVVGGLTAVEAVEEQGLGQVVGAVMAQAVEGGRGQAVVGR